MHAAISPIAASRLARPEPGFYRVLRDTVLVQSLAAAPYGIFAAMQSRMLGAAGRGDVAVTVTITFFAVAVADLGYTAAMPFHVGQNKATGQTLLGNFLVWSAVSIPLVLVGLGLLTSSRSPFHLGGYFRDYAVPIGAMMVANQLYNFVRYEALSWKDYSTYNLLSALGQGTMPLALAGVFLVAPDRLSVEAVIGCYITGYLVATGAVPILARDRLRPYRGRWGVSLRALISHLRVGVKSFLSVIAGQLVLRLDVLILYAFGQGAREIGFYSVAVLLAALWDQVPSWTATILGPKAAHNDPGHDSISVRLATAALGAGILAGAGLLAMLPVLPGLLEATFGAGFGQVYGLLLLLLPRLILLPAGQILAGNLAGKGYGLYHPLAAIAGLLTSVALNFTLIPRYGMWGAALTMGLTYVLQFAIILRGFCVMNGLTKQDMVDEVGAFGTDLLGLARTRLFVKHRGR